MEKISETVFKYVGTANAYLIMKPKVMVIDTSRKEDKEKVRKEFSSIIDPATVEIVILTHVHLDHVGNLDLFPNAEFYLSSDEFEDFKENPYGAVLDAALAKKLSTMKFSFLKETFQGLNVIPCPGHTRGSVALYDPKQKILFSGDTLFFNGLYGRLDLPTAAPEKMKSTLENLKRCPYKTLCPGHDYR